MWSLPDINRLNANAAANAGKLRHEAARKRKPQCEIYGCKRRAKESTLWFDIFSDSPKGVVHTCSEHSATHDPDLFVCEGCQRVVLDHFTWERYQVQIGGVTLCLKCAAEAHFSDPANWIDPRAVKQVVLEPEGVPLFDSKTGVLNAARCRHVLGVKQPIPAGISFHDNSEFDSCDGHQISGGNLLDVIERLNQPFCPVLDAAYRFAVSIGLYVRDGEQQRQKEAA
ncbi:MAG TPA: hypothetical protein VN578_21170 [Candidatus Binatia bacterium]|jgi:predicted Fe-S protein YdhL (DUF1289 family)|nr:hypothetical protein [Candidatus Binatia bacterium]